MWLHLLEKNPADLGRGDLLALIRATSAFVSEDVMKAIDRVVAGTGSHVLGGITHDTCYTDVQLMFPAVADNWEKKDPVTQMPLRELVRGVSVLKNRLRFLAGAWQAKEEPEPEPKPESERRSEPERESEPKPKPKPVSLNTAPMRSSASFLVYSSSIVSRGRDRVRRKECEKDRGKERGRRDRSWKKTPTPPPRRRHVANVNPAKTVLPLLSKIP
jgi:hypothetical protein